MENEIVCVDVREVTIPTEKLNTVQQKQYKEYGLRTLNEIEDMTRKLMETEFQEFKEKNEAKLWEDLERKNPKIANLLAAYNTKRAGYEKLVEARRKEVEQVNVEIEKLKSKKETILSGYTKKAKDIYFSVKKDIETLEKSKIVESDIFRLDLDERETRNDYITSISNFGDKKFRDVVDTV